MNSTAVARANLLRTSSDAAARVFVTILTRSPISRIEVARLAGLSQAAVTKAVTPLIAAGLIDESFNGPKDGLPGRPANPVSVVPNALIAVGIKVNPDELVGVATDLTTKVLVCRRVQLASSNVLDVINQIADLVRELHNDLGPLGAHIACVGISISGDVDVKRAVVRESANMGWSTVALGEELEERLGHPVIVENDVRALTIGEHWFGLGLGTASFAIVTIGRGIGSGLHLNGEVVEGAYGVAGEIGHLPLTSPLKICACGRRGCVEAVASTAAIISSVSAELGRAVTIEDAVLLARQGNRAATDAFNEAATVIGTAIASLVSMVGPEVVIIGGEAVTNFDLYDDRLMAAFHAHTFGAADKCRVIVRPHSFEDWARGAAAAAIRSLVTDRPRTAAGSSSPDSYGPGN